MKFTIQRNPFTNELSNVTRAIPVKSTIPILTGIKLTVTEEGVTLIGSDAEISIESFLSVDDEQYQLKIIETGEIVITARLFVDIIRKLPTDEITLESNDQFLLTISSGQAIFNLNGIDADSYPHLPEINNTNKINLPTILFKDLINQTIFSASNQESRPILTGLHLTAGENYLQGVATDSHRLSRREIPVNYKLNQMNFESINIPKKTVIELSKIVQDHQSLQMIIAEKQVIFIIDNLIIYSRLLEGNYPDTERLIPTESTTEIVVDSFKFLAAIDRASLIAHQGKNNAVQLKIENKKVQLSVISNERGQVNEEIDTKSFIGEDIKISFNPDYMKEALRSFGNTDINIGFQSSVRPLLLTSAEKNNELHDELLQLLTPIRTHY